MKNRQLHFFLLEFTLSLFILSVSLMVALSMFTSAARMHSETQALRSLSAMIVMKAEVLRNPTKPWPIENTVRTETSTYDVHGEPSTNASTYTLTIHYDTRSDLNKASLILTDKTGKTLFSIKVSTQTEVNP